MFLPYGRTAEPQDPREEDSMRCGKRHEHLHWRPIPHTDTYVWKLQCAGELPSMFECLRYNRESYIIVGSRRLYQFLYVNGQVHTNFLELHNMYITTANYLSHPKEKRVSLSILQLRSKGRPSLPSSALPRFVSPSLLSYHCRPIQHVSPPIFEIRQLYNMHEVRGTWYHVMQCDTQYFFLFNTYGLRWKSRKYVYTRADRAFSVCPCHENIVAGLYGRVVAVQR